MNNYIKYANRGEFQWECVEYGDYGSVEIEEMIYNNGKGKITKTCGGFSAEYQVFDGLVFGEKEFSSRRNARIWIERMIKQ